MVGVRVTARNIHIKDSFEVPKMEFRKYIRTALEMHPEYVRRKVFPLIMEWAVHNFLYRVNYKWKQTKDVDLNVQPLYKTILYCILGCLVWVFVR